MPHSPCASCGSRTKYFDAISVRIVLAFNAPSAALLTVSLLPCPDIASPVLLRKARDLVAYDCRRTDDAGGLAHRVISIEAIGEWVERSIHADGHVSVADVQILKNMP